MENAFRVLFETFGGSTVPPATGLSYGDVITKPADPEKSARSFGGWYTDEACTQEWNFADGIPGDMTLYARWTGGITPTQTSAPVTTTVPAAIQPSTAPPTMTTPTRDATTAPPADTGDNGKSGGDGNGALYLLLLLLFLFFLCLILLLRHTVTFLVTTAEGIRTYRVRVWHGKTIDPDTLPELLRTAAWYLDEERKDRWDIEEDRVIRSIRLYHG
ncbi:MAG TPA: InlB B-repeat-containing protein, partial [Methanocorpusculum sp.]|nr:InlB B-repeat-containing protein [Methanocorpusculum sp.]